MKEKTLGKGNYILIPPNIRVIIAMRKRKGKVE